ncbi:hypothetical protein PM082_004083 [Marasmius tenuissimus]|nr:hypothetical protein PM082_004083 [Marasmius tenuissimus]
MKAQPKAVFGHRLMSRVEIDPGDLHARFPSSGGIHVLKQVLHCTGSSLLHLKITLRTFKGHRSTFEQLFEVIRASSHRWKSVTYCTPSHTTFPSLDTTSPGTGYTLLEELTLSHMPAGDPTDYISFLDAVCCAPNLKSITITDSTIRSSKPCILNLSSWEHRTVLTLDKCDVQDSMALRSVLERAGSLGALHILNTRIRKIGIGNFMENSGKRFPHVSKGVKILHK